jgi:hypothetical protein
MAGNLSVESLVRITDSIIGDFSQYIRRIIDADSARASIGYQVSLLRRYEVESDPNIPSASIVVIPKSADIVDISLVLNMHGGFARYFLTIRSEGKGKYAVHVNKLYYIDASNPSKPFDTATLIVSKEHLSTKTRVDKNIHESTTKDSKKHSTVVWTKNQPRLTAPVQNNQASQECFFCPTNNSHCCYTKADHGDSECKDPSFLCCMNAVHYSKH